MKELTIEQKAKAYDEAIEKFDVILNLNTVKESGTIFADDVRKIFPELEESEDEKIRKALIEYFNEQCDMSDWNGIYGYQVVDWLEKQGEQNPNPYTGTSFEYNNHTWGMCARDGGVEILFDGELKAFISLEKSFIYPVHPQPTLAPKSALEANKEEIEIKLEIFKAIANNSQKLCDDNKYMTPSGVADYTNEVYEILTKKE